MMERKTPIVVGVGDIVNRSKEVGDAIEPLQLIIQAIRTALADTALDATAVASLQCDIDSVDIVRSWTWPYPDLAGLVSEHLDIRPHRKYNSEHGGNQPAYLFDEAARRISRGEGKVTVVAGGEALASLAACAAANKLPPPNWTPLAEEVNSVFSPTTRELKPSALPGAWMPPPRPPLSSSTRASDPGHYSADLGARHSIGNPIHIYPLYENAFRAHRGQSLAENHAESAKLYADFARVAEANEFAWNFGKKAETEGTIGTVGGRNRLICFPYPLLMNAFNMVNLAAACVLTSTEYARELGIPEDRWIYALGGAGTRDCDDCALWQRPTFWWSPSISRSLDAGIDASGLRKEDIDLYDFYSCFPIVPKLACAHLKLPILNPPKPITLLGGLTSFGGAGNNYSMHAITAMVRQLRRGRGKNGLVLANGGVVTYQHTVCLSTSPRRDGLPYPNTNPLTPLVTDVQVPSITESPDGDATVETYTVEFNRDGAPLRGHVIGRLKSNGHRFIANHADERTLWELCSTEVEPIGRSGTVKTGDDGKSLFGFTWGMSKL